MVVGGSSGIGRAIALGLADAGADVVASSRRSREVADVAKEIRAKGRRTLAITSDVLERATLENLHAETVAAFGRVDILVNAAGTTKRMPTLEMPEKDWRTILRTNLTGMFHSCQIVAPGMVQQGWGRIINVASLATFVAFFEVAAYGVSKAGVGALTKSLAIELARHGVCVNAHRARVFPDRAERDAAGEHAARARGAAAHPDGPLWTTRRTGGRLPYFLPRRAHPLSPGRSWQWTAAFWPAVSISRFHCWAPT